MRRVVLLLSLLPGVGTARADSWSDLWLTPEQQAQQLLESGSAAAAAQKFSDARRRAYAEIEAGKFDDAASLLERFQDPQSQYNRGNAFAHAGRLENALAAYDDAIKQTSAESALGRDARHNRDLVAEQLKQQQSSQSNSSDQSQRDQRSSKNTQSQKQDQEQSGGQSQNQQDQSQPGQQDQSDAKSKNEQGNADKAHASNDSGDRRNQPASGSQDQQSATVESRESDTSQDASGDAGADDKEQDAQAQRDAAASGTQQQQQGSTREQRPVDGAKDQLSSQKEVQANAVSMPAEPSSNRGDTPLAAAQDSRPSEGTLALDQWLRQIPDDPSGLLRRKFLIEHLRRQGSQEEPQ